jgi:hypothetical protein
LKTEILLAKLPCNRLLKSKNFNFWVTFNFYLVILSSAPSLLKGINTSTLGFILKVVV